MQVKCNCIHLGDLHAFLGYAFCSCVCIVELLLICKGRNGMTRITNGMEGRERESEERENRMDDRECWGGKWGGR